MMGQLEALQLCEGEDGLGEARQLISSMISIQHQLIEGVVRLGHRLLLRCLPESAGFSLFCFWNLTEGTLELSCVTLGVAKRKRERQRWRKTWIVFPFRCALSSKDEAKKVKNKEEENKLFTFFSKKKSRRSISRT